MNKNIQVSFEGINLDGESYVMIPKGTWTLIQDNSERGHYIFRRMEEEKGVKDVPKEAE